MDGAERRRPEAAGLRALIQEQWARLEAVLADVRGRHGAARDHRRVVAATVETLVDGTDARMRLVQRYRRVLREGARAALAHVEALAAALPPPLPLAPAAHADDPRLNAFFVNAAHVADFLAADPALRAPAPTTSAIRALLLMEVTQRGRLAPALAGDVLVREVPRIEVSFGGHRLAALAADAGWARACTQYLLDTLITELRRRLPDPGDGWASRSAPAPRGDPLQRLRAVAGLLADPRSLIDLRVERLCVDRLGVRVDGAASRPVNALVLHRLCRGSEPGPVLAPVRLAVKSRQAR